MAGVTSGVCAPWAAADVDCAPCAEADFPAGVLDDALLAASNLLFLKSGRQYPGECEITVRPTPVCRDRGGRPHQGVEGVGFHTSGVWGGCGCGNDDGCRCGGFAQIGLGVGPIVAVTEVKIDGVVLDPARYRIDDWRFLTRLPDADGSSPSWPCCNDLSLPDGAVGTWTVDVTYGVAPPIEGRMAAAVYGCRGLPATEAGHVDRAAGRVDDTARPPHLPHGRVDGPGRDRGRLHRDAQPAPLEWAWASDRAGRAGPREDGNVDAEP